MQGRMNWRVFEGCPEWNGHQRGTSGGLRSNFGCGLYLQPAQIRTACCPSRPRQRQALQRYRSSGPLLHARSRPSRKRGRRNSLRGRETTARLAETVPKHARIPCEPGTFRRIDYLLRPLRTLLYLPFRSDLPARKSQSHTTSQTPKSANRSLLQEIPQVGPGWPFAYSPPASRSCLVSVSGTAL